MVVHLLPYDGVGIAKLGILGVLAAHEPHLLLTAGADALSALSVVVGDDFDFEVLVATRLDVEELIRQRLILGEVEGYGSEHIIVLHCIG